MGRSFSFSRAWERNARHLSAIERTAAQLAYEQGKDSQVQAMPVMIGDQYRTEVRRVFDEDGREIMNRPKYESVPEIPTEEMHHAGQRVAVLSKDFDRDAGTFDIEYVVENPDGSYGGTRRTRWEKTDEGEWTITDAGRRIRS